MQKKSENGLKTAKNRHFLGKNRQNMQKSYAHFFFQNWAFAHFFWAFLKQRVKLTSFLPTFLGFCPLFAHF